MPIPTATERFLAVSFRWTQQDGFGLPADDARRLVEDILRQPRFSNEQAETIFDRIGRAFTSYLQKAIGWVNENILGVGQDSTVGRFVFWTAVVAVIGLAAAFLAFRLAKRRSALEAERSYAISRETLSETPAQLEELASAAIAEHRFGEALRLMYRAGLIRLGDRGVIEYRPSLTSGEVARAIRSAAFDHLALQFDQVAYGHGDATREDISVAQGEWTALLEIDRA